MDEGVEGTLAVVTPVACASGAVVIGPPRIHILALAPGALQGTIFPPQGMNVTLTLVDIEEGVNVREYRYG